MDRRASNVAKRAWMIPWALSIGRQKAPYLSGIMESFMREFCLWLEYSLAILSIKWKVLWTTKAQLTSN